MRHEGAKDQWLQSVLGESVRRRNRGLGCATKRFVEACGSRSTGAGRELNRGKITLPMRAHE